MATRIRIGRRPRRWPLAIVAVAAVVAILFTMLAGFATDVLWFGEVGQADVFWTTLRTEVMLGAAFAVVFQVARAPGKAAAHCAAAVPAAESVKFCGNPAAVFAAVAPARAPAA